MKNEKEDFEEYTIDEYGIKLTQFSRDQLFSVQTRLWYDIKQAVEPVMIYGVKKFGLIFAANTILHHQTKSRKNDERVIRDGLNHLGVKSILSFGAGTSNIVLDLADKFDVAAYDIPNISFEFAKWRAIKNKRSVQFYEDTSEIKKKFDVILCIDALEHMDEPWAAIDLFKKLLRKGGYLINTWAPLDKYDFDIGLKPWILSPRPDDYWIRMLEEGFEAMRLFSHGYYTTIWKWTGETIPTSEIRILLEGVK